MFLKICPNSFNETIAAQQEIRISDDQYGNDVCSYYELVKGFARPFESGNLSKTIHDDLLKATEILLAKRKLNLVLKSKSMMVFHSK